MVDWQPHAYQKKAVRFMVQQNCAGLLLDPGLGKTSCTYAAYHVLRKRDLVERMLVVAPLRPAESTWPREQQKWDEFRRLNVHVLHGGRKEELLRQPHDVSIINPEGLKWLLGHRDAHTGAIVKGAAQKAGVWWDMLVVDESTRFKHANTERFKILRPHLPKFKRRYILTGSPAPNGLIDLYGQMYILDLGRALGPYMTQFLHTYFDKTGFMGHEHKLKEDAAQRIEQAVAPLVLRMSAEDYLDLPPLVGVDPPLRVDVMLDEKARKAYTQMEALLLADLEDGTVTAANAAAATIKCRQIANGGLYKQIDSTDACFRASHLIHEAKAEAVAELVEELSGKPALVAYEFAHDLQRLIKVLGKDTPYLGGGVSSKTARDLEDAWNAGALPVLLVQPQSAAHGLNLQGGGNHVIWHSLPWDLELYEQMIRRLWRQGQKGRVLVHHVVACDTIDEAVLCALRSKNKTQQALLAGLKEYAKTRRI